MSVRRAHVTVQPLNVASLVVSHGDRLKALESYIPKRKAAVGAVAQQKHVVRISATLKEIVMKKMAEANTETNAMSTEEAKEFWRVTNLEQQLHEFLEDGKFTAAELAKILAQIAEVQSELLNDMEACEEQLEQSEARLEQYSKKLADESYESYSPFDSYEPFKPPPRRVRAMRAVVAMLAAGGTLMAAVQSAQATRPGQAFDVERPPSIPWSVQQQSLGAHVV